MKIRGFSLTSRHALLVLLVIAALAFAQTTTSSAAPAPTAAGSGFTDAAAFGFSPEASGLDNAKALQRAVDRTGTIVVQQTRHVQDLRDGLYRQQHLADLWQ